MSRSRLLELKGRYVHIPMENWVFKKNKIICVTFRSSFLYWKYPYMMSILYAKQWSESTMIGVGEGKNRVMFPITSHHDTLTYKLKILHRSSIERYQDEWESIGVKVENKVSAF